MNAVTNGTGKYSTTCKFCSKRVVEAPSLDIPIIGEPGKQAKELMTVLAKHMNKYHAAEFKAGAALLDDVFSFLVFNAFDHQDPSIPARLERIRAAIFAQVRKNTIADPMLEHLVAGLGLDPDDADQVVSALRTVRDACCELGSFAATTSPAQQPALITP